MHAQPTHQVAIRGPLLSAFDVVGVRSYSPVHGAVVALGGVCVRVPAPAIDPQFTRGPAHPRRGTTAMVIKLLFFDLTD